MTRARLGFVLVGAMLTACGGDDGGTTPTPACQPPPLPAAGDPNGHPEPLGSAPGQARAGRIASAAQLPRTTLGLETWEPGDFVLANDRVALVIEDVGAS